LKNRYWEFDIARTIALILMPLAHLAESLENVGAITEDVFIRNGWILQIASLGVMVFMVMLGVNILLTRHNSPKELFHRGIRIFALGMLLNVFRYLLPGIISIFVYENTVYFSGSICYCFSSDILFFAAFCFFFFAFVRKLNLNFWIVLFIGCILNLFDYLLPNPILKDPFLSAIAGNFIYVDKSSAFSFAQWSVAVCMGYVFGKLYLSQENKRKFYGYAILLSSVGLSVALLVCYLFNVPLMNEIGSQYINYNLSLSGAFILFLTFLLLQGIAYFIFSPMKNTAVVNAFVSFSKGITVYYFIQWVIVACFTVFLCIIGYGTDRYLASPSYLLCGILIILLSTALTFLLRLRKAHTVK